MNKLIQRHYCRATKQSENQNNYQS